MEQEQIQNQKKKLSDAEAFSKIVRFCAYQERSHKEVKNKLFSYGVNPTRLDEILSRLITEGFINEERFAKTFAGGKFRMMKWGKLKIKKELEMTGVSPRNIKSALAEIDTLDYLKTIRNLIAKKSSQLHEENIFKKKNKLAKFLIGKGYEPELVWETMNNFLA